MFLHLKKYTLAQKTMSQSLKMKMTKTTPIKSSNKDKYCTIMEVCNTPAVNYGQYYIKNGWK